MMSLQQMLYQKSLTILILIYNILHQWTRINETYYYYSLFIPLICDKKWVSKTYAKSKCTNSIK